MTYYLSIDKIEICFVYSDVCPGAGNLFLKRSSLKPPIKLLNQTKQRNFSDFAPSLHPRRYRKVMHGQTQSVHMYAGGTHGPVQCYFSSAQFAISTNTPFFKKYFNKNYTCQSAINILHFGFI